ncbi:MAG TPA: sigma-70 family RNA polymerase sigma factor [Polyangiaceae bacterium]|nr:sigma-70 family RNA polymerase sigma factor [Polyangiaceae bacterium]
MRVGLAIVDQVARERLARSLRGAIDAEDLVGYGRVAALDAARRFEPSLGIPFEAYAFFRIRRAIIDAVRGMALSRRTYERVRAAEAATRVGEGLTAQTLTAEDGASPPSMAHKLAETMAAMSTAVALGVVAEVVTQNDGELVSVDHSNPEQKVSDAQLKELVVRFVGELPKAEAELIRRHYLEDERFDKVAEDLNFSKSWASRLHARAMVRLMKRVRSAS